MTILGSKERGEKSRDDHEQEIRRKAFAEQVKYYRDKNNDRENGRVGRGLALICSAIIIAGYLQMNWTSIVQMKPSTIMVDTSNAPLYGIPLLAIGLCGLAIVCLLAGIVLLFDLRNE